MSEAERLKNYSEEVYLGDPNDLGDIERHPYHLMRLKGCMFAAMCYAYGYTSYEAATQAFDEPAETFREQVSNIKKHQTRHPQLVLEIGSGRGELAAAFHYDGVKCYAVDPSPGAAIVTPRTFRTWIDKTSVKFFMNKSMLDGVRAADLCDLRVDTVILCEAIEHIREDEFNEAYPIIEKMLTKTRGRLIITNWVGYHPIYIDGSGWDHIREINDTVYNDLNKNNEIILRKGSHYVLQY